MDSWLLEKGIERRLALTVPSYLQALHAAAATDLVAFVPKRLAQRLSAQLSLAVLRSPLDPGTYQESLLYPRVLERDAAARWFRDIVLDVGRRLGANGRP